MIAHKSRRTLQEARKQLEHVLIQLEEDLHNVSL